MRDAAHQEFKVDNRLSALRRYNILDTGREADFDQIVLEASQQCGTPIAMISLVDSHRQWFKAEVGMGTDQTNLDRSICAKAIEYDGVFVVPDTTDDPRVNTNPLVTGPEHIRFYAGAPLVTPDGFVLGTVCVLDYWPRPEGLRRRESEALSRLAEVVMSKLENRLSGHQTTGLPDAPAAN